VTGLQKKAAFLCWRVEAAGGPPANRSIRSGRKRDAGILRRMRFPATDQAPKSDPLCETELGATELHGAAMFKPLGRRPG
jgi:hypothetical protein